AIDQRTSALAYPVALGVAARAMQRLIGGEALRLENALQCLKAKVLGRETILRQSKIQGHELRCGAAQTRHHLTLMRQRLPERMRQQRIGRVLQSAREGV